MRELPPEAYEDQTEPLWAQKAALNRALVTSDHAVVPKFWNEAPAPIYHLSHGRKYVGACGACAHFDACKDRKSKGVTADQEYCAWPQNRYAPTQGPVRRGRPRQALSQLPANFDLKPWFEILGRKPW